MELTRAETFEILSKRAYDIGFDLKALRNGSRGPVFTTGKAGLLAQIELFYKDCSKALTDAD